MNQLNFDGISFNADYAASQTQEAFVAEMKANPSVQEKWGKKSPENIDKDLAMVYTLSQQTVKPTDNDNSGGDAKEIPAGEPTGADGGRGGGEPETATGLQSGATVRTGRGQSGKEADKV